MNSRPAVVIPIFNARSQLERCLSSVIRCLRADDQVLLADDASTDAEILPLLERVAQTHAAQISILRNERNLGFVGNVNRALSDLSKHDIVLLNSDTEVTAGWLDAIQATAQRVPSAATITPWSNNAEICSFPQFCQAAPMPTVDEAEQIARAALELRDCEIPELPTAVGFAMYIRRAALDQLGDFDAATFGRGYGEENDFCMRAAAMGWRNVLCPTAYVAHQGNASFSEVGLKAGGDNLQRLLARYPDYNRRVAEFIEHDPLAPLRARLQSALERQRFNIAPT
ncbi:glycosyltransferase family 2 protein [Pseudomarimonas arenosa]|uniref:Glycosyltransferase n=1 Tax=Pseudomarimonas arenosa TaxID=2774145 RepID=A0AAW3ZP68_9GAMM|nr:glycosyltransferase [Pseudomarimonas arenosa]MBD8526439.1 glycosyltransferase [Pseudomarimonas arenosa]